MFHRTLARTTILQIPLLPTQERPRGASSPLRKMMITTRLQERAERYGGTAHQQFQPIQIMVGLVLL